ncbi:hypothetical protein M769_0123465 [Bacillus haynesii]|nr:hypothetical protein M769_0123465 [Bacillus haynesii]
MNIAFPFKRNREISKKFKMLDKEGWYQNITCRLGTFIQMNLSVRRFIAQSDVERILNETGKFRIE